MIDDYKYRFEAIDKIALYLNSARLAGDYIEFGVWEGKLFDYACKVLPEVNERMKFIAVDSWKGLPALQYPDIDNGYASGFRVRQFTVEYV